MKPSRILYPFSFLYLLVFNISQRIRKLKQKKLSCNVISVGNITVGGTGKTPAVIYIAELLKKMKKNVCVISGGYKSEIDSPDAPPGPRIVTDGKKIFLGPRLAGDEPCLIARSLEGVPVIVDKNRHLAGLLAISKFGIDTVILDDGFQHLNLFREIDIVCINALNPFGNNLLLPAGYLREPVKNISRASAFIITRCDKVTAEKVRMIDDIIRKYKKDAPIFHGFFSKRILSRKGKEVDVFSLLGRNVIAISGIAVPEDFESTLMDMGMKVLVHKKYPDHYFFKDKDIKRYYNDAAEFQAVIVTTAKDACRLPGEFPCYILDIKLEVQEKDRLGKFLGECLDKKV